MVLFFVLYSCFLKSASAQTWDEWFRQKKTQIKYLTQQIAALQVYEGYLSRGYQIAKQGLDAIGKGKNDEFNLHQQFFTSLSLVNPAIKHYTRIADIIALQYNTLAQYKLCMKEARQNQQVSGSEIGYINSVFASLLKDCANDIGDLILLTTDNQLQLSDDERLHRMDALYNRMLDKNNFAQHFHNELGVLIRNRQNEQKETLSIKELFNLK